jgi:hypothetical protein
LSHAASGDAAAAAEKQGITDELEYRWYCGQCHGMNATGNGPVAPALRKRPANLRLLSKNNGGVFPREEVRDFIDGRKVTSAHGSREMPIWGMALRGNQPGVYFRENRSPSRRPNGGSNCWLTISARYSRSSLRARSDANAEANLAFAKRSAPVRVSSGI